MKKIIFCLFVFVFMLPGVHAATLWVNNPVNCPSEDQANFLGQNCAPEDICGDSSGLARCYDTGSLNAPNSNTTTNTNVDDGSFDGGYLVDCYVSADGASPFCDNGGTFWCDRSSSCFSTYYRDTICLENQWGASSCGDCRSGRQDCYGDTICESTSTSDCQNSNNNHYVSCVCTCDTNYYACDGSIIDTDGCEINAGASCGLGTGYIVLDECFSTTQGNCTATGARANNRDCDDSDSDGDEITCNTGNGCEITLFYDTNNSNSVYQTCTTFACDSGYLDCNGPGDGTDENGCEITEGASCGNGTGTYAAGQCAGSSGNCTRSGTNLDCNNDDSDSDELTCNGVTDGCEIVNGSACSVGVLSGTYSGCSGLAGNCIVSKSYFETGTETAYSTDDALLWGVQYGSGHLMNFTNANTNESFLVNNSGCIVFPDNTTQCTGTLSTNFTNVAYTNQSNTFSENQTFSSNITVVDTGFFGWLGSLVNRITKLFVVDIDASGNVDIAGNLTVDNDTLFVDSDNNRIGIGTTSPSADLHIEKWEDLVNLRVYNSNQTGGIAKLIVGGWGGGHINLISNDNPAAHLGIPENTAGISVEYGGVMPFAVGSGGSASEKMRIEESGNVGIGTTSPTQRLDVNGSVNISGNIQTSGNISILNDDGTLLSIGGSDNNAFIKTYDSSLEFIVNESKKIILKKDGSIEINVTNPCWNATGPCWNVTQPLAHTLRIHDDTSPNSWARFQAGETAVYGSMVDRFTLWGNNLYWNQGPSNIERRYLVSDFAAAYFTIYNGNLYYYTADAGTAGEELTNTNTRFSITQEGLVTIYENLTVGGVINADDLILSESSLYLGDLQLSKGGDGRLESSGGIYDLVESDELDNVCGTNDKILKRSGGSWVCADDADSNTLYYAGGIYIYKNGSDYFILNETKLNSTIDDLILLNETNGLYIYDGGRKIYLNETKLNDTINLIGNYSAGDGITIVGKEINATLGTSVSNTEIDSNAVNTTQIIDGTIIADDISAGSINTTHILDGTILTEDIADNNITATKIAPDSINGTELSDTLTLDANMNIVGGYDFSVNNSDLYVDVSSGRVGIGTISPSEALDVNGNITMSGDLDVGGSIIAGPYGGYGQYHNLLKYSEDLSQWTNVFGYVNITSDAATAPNGQDTADQVNFTSNGLALRLSGLSLGGVGTNYTLSFWGRVISGSGTITWDLSDGSSSTATLTSEWDKYSVTLPRGSGGAFLDLTRFTGVGVIEMWGLQLNNGTEVLPYVKTENAAITNLNYGAVTSGNHFVSGDLNVTGVYYGNGSGLTDLNGSAIASDSIDGTELADTINLDANMNIDGGYNFSVNNSDLFVDVSSGNVGIGTTSPGAKLDVEGSINAINITLNNQSIITTSSWSIGFINTLSGSPYYPFFRTADSDGTDDLKMILSGWYQSDSSLEFLFFGWDEAEQQYEIRSNALGNGTVRNLSIYTLGNDNQLFLDTNGNVGIGTATPSATLDVNGDLNVDSGVFYVNASTNKVGVGTTSPTEKLHIDSGTFLQTPGNPTIVGTYTSAAYMEDPEYVDVVGKYAYVTSFTDDSLTILDISDPTSPAFIGWLQDTTNLDKATGINVISDYAYVSTQSGRLSIVDVSLPTSPTLVGSLSGLGVPLDSYISEQYAYVPSSGQDKLYIIDVSIPSTPTVVGSVVNSTYMDFAWGVYVIGDYAYVAGYISDSFAVVDVSDPANPSVVGGIINETYLNSAEYVYANGRYAYVTGYLSDSLAIIDILDPTNPTIVGGISTGLNGASKVKVLGDYAYVTEYVSNALSVVDVSDPTSPSIIGTQTGLTTALGLDVSGKYAYVVEFGSHTLSVLDIGGIDSYAASIGTISTSTLDVSENLQVGNDLYVDTGIVVGSGGIYSAGAVSFDNNTLSTDSGAVNVAGDLNVTGDLNISGVYYGDGSQLSNLPETVEPESPTPYGVDSSDLVGYWSANGNALDYSGYGNDGTLEGNTNYSDGVFGKGFEFDGVDDYINVSFSQSLNFTDEIALMAWVKVNNWDSSTNRAIVGKASGGNRYLFYIQSTNVLRFVAEGLTPNDDAKYDVSGLNDNLWYHLAATYNGNQIVLYINGDSVNTTQSSGSIRSSDVDTGIGVRFESGQPPNLFFNGSIDEVMMFNRSLSATEIQSLYNAGNKFKTSGNSLYYDGNVGIGTTNPTQALDVAGSVKTSDSYVFSDGSTQAIASTPDGLGWSVATAVLNQNFNVSTQSSLPASIFFKPDGKKMYTVGNGNKMVNEYDVSTPWDISTAVFNQSLNVNSQESNPRGVFFKQDGTKMYIIGYNGDEVNEYDVSTPWDISTTSFNQLFSVVSQETLPQGFFFRSDGGKLYITGQDSDAIIEYNISTPWDISTASFNQNFSILTQENNAQDVFFKPDGTKMYMVGNSGNDINEYDVSTPWDISTAVFSKRFDVSGEETNPTGVFFKPDGTKMYMIGSDTDMVYEYDLGIIIEGKVGIGTTSPSSKLEVNGDVNLNDTLYVDGAGNVGIGITDPVTPLHVYQNNAETGDTSYPGFTVEQDGTGDAIIHYLLTDVTRWVTGVDNSDGDAFKIAPSTASFNANPILNIETGGNVGIGTTSPTQKLDVNGSVNVSGTVYANNLWANNNLDVGGSAEIDSYLDVYGNSYFDDWVDFESYVIIKDYLTVSGQISAGPYGGFGQYQNLLPYSENLSAWTNYSAATITSTNETAPNGQATATRISISGGGILFRQTGLNTSASTNYTVSVWAKLVSGSPNPRFDIGDGGAGSTFVLTSNWERLSYVIKSGSNASKNWLDLNNFVGTGVVDLWGFQVNEGNEPLPYVETLYNDSYDILDDGGVTSGDHYISRDLTVEGVIYGDGSQLTGITTSWNESGGNVYLANSSNNVGIGTASPTTELEVVGDITSKGTKWTSRTSAADNSWYDVAYGNGLFVAVASSGTGNRVMTSPDGITWTNRTSASDNNWRGITYGNGLFVATSITGTGNRVMTSPDGITWTSRTSAADNSWYEVTYGNGLFVAVSTTGTGDRVMTSPDGITWTSRASASDNDWDSVTYGNGLFVAISEGPTNEVMTSPDGITWTNRTASSASAWIDVAYGNGLFVAIAWTGTDSIMTSPDGITWTARTSPNSNYWRAITYGNGLFVATAQTGTGNRVMTSPDGITWTARTSAADNPWFGVTYGNGIFVAVSIDGTGDRVMTSGKSEMNVVPHNNIQQGGFEIRGDLNIAGSLFQPVYGSDDGLVLYMPFSEPNGSTHYDRSPYGNDGTQIGNTVCNSTLGKYGSGCSFDGDGDYVNLSKVLSGTGKDLTISAWIYPKASGSSTDPYSQIFQHRGPSSRDNLLSFTDSNTIDLRMYDSVGGQHNVYSSSALPLNDWSHVVATYDGATMKIYINGKLDNSASDAFITEFDTNYAGTYIGDDAYTGDWGKPFNGSIDEVMVYERALSEDEIRTHYLRGSGFGASGAITADKFRIVNTSGDVKFIVDEDGKVGIGTTSPASKLQVHSDSAINTSVQITNSVSGSSSSDGMLIGLDADGTGRLEMKDDEIIKIYTSNSNEVIRTGRAGYVGQITLGFISNNEAIIAGDIYAGGYAGIQHMLADDTMIAQNGNGRVVMSYAPSQYLQIQTNNSVNIARFDGNGNVGIGTTNPEVLTDIEGRLLADYITEEYEDLGFAASQSALSAWVAMIGDTITYGTAENNTRIYINGELQVATTGPSTGTFSVSAGDIITTNNKPVGLVAEDSHQGIAPLSLAGTLHGFFSNRNTPHTIYVYAPYAPATVLYFDDGYKDSDSVNQTLTVRQGEVGTITTSSEGHHRLYSSAPIVVTKAGTGGGGDYEIIPPASREILHNDGASEGIDGVSAMDSSSSYSNNGGYYYSEDGLLYAVAIGDGNGGDMDSALPWKAAGDTYIIPHTMAGYQIMALEPTNVSVWRWNSSDEWELVATHDLTSASRLNPVEVSIGLSDDGGSSAVSSAPVLVTGERPFYFRTNDPSHDEYPALGYRTKKRTLVDDNDNWAENGTSIYYNGGNVGIGTTSPNAELHIQDTGSPAVVAVERTDGVWGELLSGSNAVIYGFENAGEFWIAEANSGINPGDSWAGTTHLVVESGGEVGIGTSSPANDLEIEDTADTTVLRIQDSSNTCDFGVDGSGWASISCSSDEKLKEDIGEIPNEKISKKANWVFDYPLKEYTIKANKERQIGVIAQDIKERDPSKVKNMTIFNKETNQEETYLAVEAPTTTDLILAIQGLKKMFDDLVGGNYSVESKAVFNGDMVGTVTILVNETEVEIVFEEEYPVAPIVTVTPIGLPNFFYGVDEITTKGFKILISEAQEKEIVFNWHAFAQEVEEVVNVTINDTNITVPTNLTEVNATTNETFETNLTANETVDVNITVPEEVNQTIPEDSNESNNDSVPINVTEPVNETEEVNQTTPENETSNVTVPINESEEINQTTPEVDITLPGNNSEEMITNETENSESNLTNNSFQKESIESNEENKSASPLTGGVIGTNNQDTLLTKLIMFMIDLFK